MSSFNVRVYGILINNEQEVLVSDELIRGSYITKFPGGGLELGEGTKDCLKREFKEETGLDVMVGKHIYTTDYFQLSAFNPNDQIISIYYFVTAENVSSLNIKTKIFDFELHQVADPNGQSEVLRWIDWNDFIALLLQV